MEVFSRMFSKAEADHASHGIRIARGAPPISHLLFADDVMLFCRANCGEVLKLHQCLAIFATWFGQLINHQKSYLHFSCNMTQEAWVASI